MNKAIQTAHRSQGADSGSGKPVLVIGAGIAGATAALRLSEAGVPVYLVEKQPRIGGHAARMGCKASDTCVRCNVCVADEIFRGVPQSPAIRLHTSTRLARLEPGRDGLRYTAVLESVPSPAGARRETAVGVDSIVVAIGYEPYDPTENSAYHYASLPNVITGVEAERQLAEQSALTRPSDGAVPARVAFVQCVGSRTEEIWRRPEDTDYCSTVCCAYALRMARQLTHRNPGSEVTVFYMDIQNFGKGFNAFFADCRSRMRFIRSRPYELQAGADGAVRVCYAPETADAGAGAVASETFDLVVLSVGIRPPADGRRLADQLGVAMDPQGFFGLKGAGALPDLQRKGLYVIGAAESPKDIAGSMAQAEAASAAILSEAGESGGGVAGAAEPAGAETRAVCRDVAVLGGGVAGLQAALALSDLGHAVSLVHRDPALGGTAAARPECYGYLGETAEEAADALGTYLGELTAAVQARGNVTVHAGSRVESVRGELGDFTLRVSGGGGATELRAGALVLAVGAGCAPILTEAQRAGGPPITDLAGLLAFIRAEDVPARVAILLDMAAEQGRAVYAQTFSAAERLATRFGAQVTLYGANMRVAAAGLERLYRRVRDAGVVPVRWAKKPTLATAGGKVQIRCEDPVAGGVLSEEVDLAVLADLAPARNGEAGLMAGFRAGPEGALQYDDVWLLPTLTNRPGVFVAGAARGNSEYREALTDGLAAARAVHGLLATGRIAVADGAARVDAEKCVACLTCLRICPHGAITFDVTEAAASISAVSCQRCGVCAAECPAKAITLPGFEDEQVAAAIGGKPRITVFACENSAVPACEAAARAGKKCPRNVKLVRVPCAGRVDPQMILTALEQGADKVFVAGCHPESCQYLSGASRGKRRAEQLSASLARAGVDAARVEFFGVAAVEPNRFVEMVTS
ncbi:MAG: hydrogenase iron-sulfur subunit [Kiritimatiellae bacterium]|nr:hydrogenase iron-sulfur subunit [Kiritimatiellia bacterium]